MIEILFQIIAGSRQSYLVVVFICANSSWLGFDAVIGFTVLRFSNFINGIQVGNCLDGSPRRNQYDVYFVFNLYRH